MQFAFIFYLFLFISCAPLSLSTPSLPPLFSFTQLKAFYVDLLVPLETNLEKDTKVVQHEQKKFLQQHKVRMESFQKAVTTMKKQRKKKASPENTEKELRVSYRNFLQKKNSRSITLFFLENSIDNQVFRGKYFR